MNCVQTLKAIKLVTLHPTLFLSSLETSFLQFSDVAIQDMNNNKVTSIADGAAIQPKTYASDELPPSIITFDLDMNTATLSMYGARLRQKFAL